MALFVAGCFVGAFVMFAIMALLSVAANEEYCDKCGMWHEKGNCPYCGE